LGRKGRERQLRFHLRLLAGLAVRLDDELRRLGLEAAVVRLDVLDVVALAVDRDLS
jgi:hypothetical protein